MWYHAKAWAMANAMGELLLSAREATPGWDLGGPSQADSLGCHPTKTLTLGATSVHISVCPPPASRPFSIDSINTVAIVEAGNEEEVRVFYTACVQEAPSTLLP